MEPGCLSMHNELHKQQHDQHTISTVYSHCVSSLQCSSNVVHSNRLWLCFFSTVLGKPSFCSASSSMYLLSQVALPIQVH